MNIVILYEKGKSGHRSYIGDKIIANLNIKNSKIVLLNGPDDENFLQNILIFALKNIKAKIHCHLLTLDDCIFDFLDKNLLKQVQKLNITFSGTLFNFEWLQIYEMLRYIKDKVAIKEFPILFTLLKQGLIKKVFIPDERVKNRLLYPCCNNKLVYLPDFSRIKKKAILKKNIFLKNKISLNSIVFLIFGTMNDYKGINFLIKAINDNLIHPLDKNIIFIIAGKNKNNMKINNVNKKVTVFKYNNFIKNDFANLLFYLTDCVILPFDKKFKKSSGTFVLAVTYGKFLIVPNQGVLKWRVKKYKNGYLFKANNTHSLAKAINKFISRKSNISMPVKGSLKYAKQCKIENYIEILNKNIYKIIK